MTLVDAGPLVAIIDADDPEHELCLVQLTLERPPLHTTWPALTEAMHLLRHSNGYSGQAALWRLLEGRVIALAHLTPPMITRTAELMATYADTPMDLADATLVALAEVRNDSEIFTLDSDFEVYRLPGRRKFKIVPA